MAELDKLIKACLNKKRRAQREVYDLLVDQLYWTAKRYLKHEEDIEEVLADSFYTIFTKLNQLKSSDALYTWSKRIVINNCLKRIKNRFTHYVDSIFFQNSMLCVVCN